MSDDIQYTDYETDNSLDGWRTYSAVALEKKSPDWTNIEPQDQPVKVFRYPLEATNQAIDDAHTDDSFSRTVTRLNALLDQANMHYELNQPTVDERVAQRLVQRGLDKDHPFARGYEHKYRLTRKQLTR